MSTKNIFSYIIIICLAEEANVAIADITLELRKPAQ
jgi:hypothetical protein